MEKKIEKKKSNLKYYILIGIILIAIIIRFVTLSSNTIEPTKIESKYIVNNTLNSSNLIFNNFIAQLSTSGSFIFIMSICATIFGFYILTKPFLDISDP